MKVALLMYVRTGVSKFILILVLTISAYHSALASPAVYNGAIDLQTAPVKRINVILTVDTTFPVTGTLKNVSHLAVDPGSHQALAVCEFDYTFKPSQVTITLSLQDGTSLGAATTEISLKGTIYTDSPDFPDAGLCDLPSAAKFPITGPLDVVMGGLKNFQLPDGVLLALDSSKDAFKNTAVISLQNQEPTSPVLSSLIFAAIEGVKWNTFGTDAPGKSGVFNLLPSK